MSDPIEWLTDPDLHEPTLLAAFSGWGDAAEAATGAVRWLVSQWHGERLARIQPNEFFDFTVARPSVRLQDGGQRGIVWPGIDVYAVKAPELEQQFVLIHGREPHLRWLDFTEVMVSLARRCGVTRALTLGAFLGPVLHTAPVSLTGFAGGDDLKRRLAEEGVMLSTYEGQTGIASVLHEAFRRAGITSLSLWAAVPFYLGNVKPNPRASYALLDGLKRVVGLNVDLGRLRQAAGYFDDQVERQVRENKDLSELIARFEARSIGEGGMPESGTRAQAGAGELPNADAIIKDLEDFFRGRQEGEGPS